MLFEIIIVSIILLPILILTVKSIITKKVISMTERKILVIFVIINITYVMLLASFFGLYVKMITFWINLALNGILAVILLCKKLVIKQKPMVIIMITFLLCMIFIPTYKYEDHKHTFATTYAATIAFPMEVIEEYVNYCNWYGIPIITIYK